MMVMSCVWAFFHTGLFSAGISSMCFGVRMPATTSSPCALIRYSPIGASSPVAPSRVNATPVPDSSPMLPYTIEHTLTAVPSRPVTLLIWRYFCARSLFQLPNTAFTAARSCSIGSCGKGFLTFCT